MLAARRHEFVKMRAAAPGACMVLINYAGREINAKIVYYGPGLSGKTTNLECIYASVPSNSRGKMVSMKTRQDRTLFFDFLPLELGEVHGFRTRFLLYTVPGQVFYNATRKLVLKGADAVVFVADSGLGKMDDNAESLRNLEENLREQGLSLETVPWVIQYNKRDLPQLYSIDELQNALNPKGVPSFEAAAASGQGVYETLHAVSRLLFQRLMTELRPASAGRGTAAPGSMPNLRPAAPAPAVSGPASRPTLPVAPAPAPPAPQVQRTSAPPAHPGTVAATADLRAATAASTGVATAVETRRAAPVAATQRPAPEAAQPAPFFAAAPQAEAASPELETQQAGEYATYGHVVDLAFEAGPGTQAVPSPAAGTDAEGGFIRDPLRRPEVGGVVTNRGSSPPPAAVRTQHVTVVISRAELKAGGTIRLIVDLRVES